MSIKKTVKKRRLRNKTDYLTRLKLLKSEKPRLVFRRTNRSVIAQVVESREAQDKILFGLTSKALLKYGWPENFKNSLKSIPASYLTGYLISKKIQENKISTPIVDFGMYRTIHKTKLFAFLKGVIDGGLNISCPEESFPEEERIQGQNLKEDFTNYFNQVKSKINEK